MKSAKAPQRQKLSLWRRCLIGGVLVIAALLTAIALLAVVLAWWPDIAKPDDLAMKPKWSNVGKDNPLAALQQWLAEHPNTGRADNRFRMAFDDDEWDAETADELISENTELMSQFDQLVASLDDSWQWEETDKLASYSSDFPYLQPIQNMANLASIRSRQMTEQDNVSEGIRLAVNLMKVGKKLGEAEGALVHWLVGRTCWANGMKRLDKALPKSNMDSTQLAELQKDMAGLHPEAQHLQFALKAEYLTFTRLLDDLKSGRHARYLEQKASVHPVFMPYLQKNRSKAMYLEIVQPFVENLDKGWKQGDMGRHVYMEQVRTIKADLFKLLVHPNAVGQMLIALALPTTSRLVEIHYYDKALHQCVIVGLELRRHQLTHGKLPEELLADNHGILPTDGFDEKPLKWNKKTGVIYSVGPDLKDDGGLLEREMGAIRIKRPDVGISYWWHDARDVK